MSTPLLPTIPPSSTSPLPPISIQEQLLELKFKEQALEQKRHEQSFQLQLEAFELKQRVFEQRQRDLEQLFEKKNESTEQAFALKQQAFALKEQAFEQKQKDIEQIFEQRQKNIEETLVLKQKEAKLELQRREDALATKIEQHIIDIQRDRTAVEKERLSAKQLTMENEQEMGRLLEIKQRIESLIQQQVTGTNSIESFHLDNILITNPSPQNITTAIPTMFDAAVEQQLATLDLRGRQLKTVSKLIERRYDDAVRKEHANEQELAKMMAMGRGIETERQSKLKQEIAKERGDFENEKYALG